MFTVLIISVVSSIAISACCSLMEAALYAVPKGFIRHKVEAGSKAAALLMNLKEDVGKPIAAILILNTVANTAGASVAGWAVASIFGSNVLAVFSIIFTLCILYCSEITPKLIGVVYCKQVSMLVARPLKVIVALLYPLIYVSESISRLVRKNESEQTLTPEEIRSIAIVGTEEGALDHFEGSVIANVIGLDETLVKDVLTPRVVVFRLNQDTIVESLEKDILNWSYSRVPIYSDDDPDHLIGYITQRDAFSALLQGNKLATLKDLSRPLNTVPELMRVDKLLLQMFSKREHICAVVDEHGGLAGIITLEDIIEEIVGREIVDEYDSVSDLRTFAKLMSFTKSRRRRVKT